MSKGVYGLSEKWGLIPFGSTSLFCGLLEQPCVKERII